MEEEWEKEREREAGKSCLEFVTRYAQCLIRNYHWLVKEVPAVRPVVALDTICIFRTQLCLRA